MAKSDLDRKEKRDVFDAPGLLLTQEPSLVVPQFDEEEEDRSSSDSDDDGPVSTSLSSQKTMQNVRGSERDNQLRETNWNRIHEIQELTNLNATLKAEARELRQQVKTLQIQLEAQTPVPGLDVEAFQELLLDKDTADHDVRDAKIIHQAKSLRAVKRSLQREKQRGADGVKRSKELETANKELNGMVETLKLKLQRCQLQTGTETIARHTKSVSSRTEGGLSENSNMKDLYEKLRVKNLALENELKKTQRVLVREIGDDVPLEEIVNNSDLGARRRGRAQQIVMLKAKVKKLQTKLATRQAEEGLTGEMETSETLGTMVDVDRRAQQDLSGQQVHRQKLVDQLTTQRDELQEQVYRLTRKYDALKARAQILEREKQENRSKFQVLMDKSRTDDALVDALQRQLETWKSKLTEARRARTAEDVKGNSSQEERIELERLRKLVMEYKGAGMNAMPPANELSQYRAIAAEKERLVEVVRDLKAQLHDKHREMENLRDKSSLPFETQVHANPSSFSLPSIGDGNAAMPRPVSKLPVPKGRSNRSNSTKSTRLAPPAVILEHEQLQHQMEILRQTFRESMRAKDAQIAALERQQEGSNQLPQMDGDADANSMNQTLQNLHEENDFLRQEFNKLKTRYETMTKPAA